MAVEDSVAQDQLRAFIERIERMNEEAEAIKADTKEIYAEAKGNGFDTKIIRKLVAIRKQDANERMEQEGLLDLYMSALGMVGVSGAHIDDRRNSIADEIDDALLETVAETAKTPEGRKALLDAVEAHKNGKKVSQLRADPALAIVEPANLKTYVQKVHESPEPQPAPRAGSDLTVPPSPQGQVADIPAAVEAQRSTPVIDVGGSGEAIQPETVNDSLGDEDTAIGTGKAVVGDVNGAETSGMDVTAGETAPLYADPGVVTWESTPPEGVERHPYSAAFGDLGQIGRASCRERVSLSV